MGPIGGAEVSLWQRWLRQPQKVWLRRALFQVHLWTGIGLGLYVTVLSLTGSALVYRTELDLLFRTPRPEYRGRDAQRVPTEQIRANAQRLYPGWQVEQVGERISRRNPTIQVDLKRGDEAKQRLFDPYTGQDLGDATTAGEWFVLWMTRLHDELLFDRTGRYVNGYLSAVFTVTVLTGLIVWWPGISRWKRSLGIKFSAGWRRVNWDLHSALGLWLFLFALMWGVSGFYLGVPEPFTDLVDRFSDPNAEYGERTGDVILMWLSRLHFGRWRDNEPLRAVWAIAGVIPAVLFVTGVIMWWNRTLRPLFKRGPAFDPSIQNSEGV
jgi:uncharacterized iron-regulated membrane protein